MVKHFMKRLVVLAVTGVALMGLTACGGVEKEELPQQEPIALVVVAGKHANGCSFTEKQMEKAAELVHKSVSYSGEKGDYSAHINTALVISDGVPRETVFEMEEYPDGALNIHANMLNKLLEWTESRCEEVIEFIGSDAVVADDPEVDLVEAVGVAQRLLRQMEGSERHILILDSGVCTSGYMDMNVLDIQKSETTEEVLAYLSEGAIHDLSGTYVTMLGLGNMGANQDTACAKDSAFQRRMEELWTGYLRDKCGATLTGEIIYDGTVDSKESAFYYTGEEGGYPYVSPVIFSVPGDGIPKLVDSFPRDQISFNGAQVTFVDREEAMKAIREYGKAIIDYLRVNPDMVVYVVGSVAKDQPNVEYTGDKNNPTRGAKRAELVKELLEEVLTEEGVDFDPEKIVPIDAGTIDFSWRNAEEFPTGSTPADPVNQAKNRVVVLVPDTDVDAMQELREAGKVD